MSIFDSIFDEKNKVTGAFFQFKAINDQVGGTLVDRRQVPDKMNPGKQQWIYELKGPNGEIILIGGKTGIDMQMKNIRLGQVIGMKYLRDKPNINPSLRAAKIIQVYADPNVVDEEWLKDREMDEANAGEAPEALPENGGPVAEALELFDSPAEKLEKIYTLAEIKLGIKETAAAEKAIMEKTGLPFLESNFDEILTKLKNI